ncbi:2-oxoacid:acceptor oxidoreductase [Cellulomonas sp. APG4]|uniref:2-oxoacid:acceptor oxidoreductase family protein n=1 Tax=Cellulomonas sp. APG4 TaxID=1538656 RepID=UPI00137AB189|nr:2-oxoacid:acceptor oxidoreductase family protein [Cellulomonas sp. APG4]NCT90774.1 2-oxoacid:acceptor oxidoreductase [Cellulomonas sp. APG4]
MFQVRFHGRGGQGVVTAAELLSVACFAEGRYAQAFPSFGSERTGAPVVSYCRIATTPIRAHEPVVDADAVVVQDLTLLRLGVLSGLRRDGFLVLNGPAAAVPAGVVPATHIAAIGATEIALTHVGRAVPNVPLLGAFAALTAQVGVDALVTALRERFTPPVAERNAAAVRAGFDAATHPEVHGAATA